MEKTSIVKHDKRLRFQLLVSVPLVIAMLAGYMVARVDSWWEGPVSVLIITTLSVLTRRYSDARDEKIALEILQIIREYQERESHES